MMIAAKLSLLCWAALFTLILSIPTPSSAQSRPERLTGLDKNLMDTKVDPCTDFYEYACGRFPSVHPIPGDRSGNSSGNMLNDYNVYLLHAILTKAAAAGARRTPNEQKIGDFYSACMNTDVINSRGVEPLKPLLDRIATVRQKNELPVLFAKLQLIGIGAFFSFSEQQDFKDARKQIAVLDQGGLGLPDRDYYLRNGAEDSKTREQYAAHVGNMLKLIGESDPQAEADTKRILQIETKIATNSLDAASQQDPAKVYHITSIRDLKLLTPQFSWDRFLSGLGVSKLTEVNVAEPEFIKGLNALIDTTDLDSLKAYLRWQVLASTPGLALPESFDEEGFDFNNHKLRGQPKQQSRSNRCVEATDNLLGEALGQVYVAQEFPPSSKTGAAEMLRRIKDAMDVDIDSLDWMSPATKIRAKEKLHTIADKIGYPDKWRDYSKLSILRDDTLGDFHRATEFENRRQLAKIGQPVDRGEWTVSPPTVDAYYNPSMNDINFPAGVLQSPIYDPSARDSVNYGHLGAMVGHETTHAFDNQGRQFDSSGNLADWWTPEDSKEFGQRSECLVKEYGNFSIADDLYVDGKRTLAENTADNGGLRLAYIAFLDDAKHKGLRVNEKDDGFTPMQQFFLAYAQGWCGVLRPEAERMKVVTDEHSPRRFRVNGVVQNMREFGAAFGCTASQPMSPPKVCRVW